MQINANNLYIVHIHLAYSVSVLTLTAIVVGVVGESES